MFHKKYEIALLIVSVIGMLFSIVCIVLFSFECRKIGDADEYWNLLFPLYLFADSLINIVIKKLHDTKYCYISILRFLVLCFTVAFLFDGIGPNRTYSEFFSIGVYLYTAVLFFSIVLFQLPIKARATSIEITRNIRKRNTGKHIMLRKRYQKVQTVVSVIGVAASTVFTILFIQECREIGSGFYSLIFPVYLFIDSLSNLVFRRIREGKICYFSLTKVIVLFFVIYFFFHGIGTDRIYYSAFMYLVCMYAGVIFFSVIIFLLTVRLRAGRISKIQSAYDKQGKKTN